MSARTLLMAAASAGPPGASLSLSFMAPGTLDPRVTFTRASTGTYFNNSGVMQTAAANAPRWDYNPNTLALNGLLTEEARTNLLLQSANFTTSWAPNAAVVTAAAGAAPDGTTTMNRLAETATTNIFFLSQSQVIAASTAYTLSVFARAAQNRYLQLGLDNGTADGGFATFDLVAGTVSGALTARGAGVIGTATIQPIGGGTYRCAITTTIGASANARILIVLANVAAPPFAPSYAGNASNGLLIWGAQLEQGAFPTSHIPTTAAAVTRAADFTTMPWTMTPALSFTYEGLSQPPLVTAQIVFDDGAGANFVRFYSAANSNMHYNVSGGNDVVVGNIGTTSIYKAAGTFISGAQTSALNGTLGPTAAAVTLPSGLTTLRLGSWFDGTLHNTSWLRRVQYWPRVLSNAELQQVTR